MLRNFLCLVLIGSAMWGQHADAQQSTATSTGWFTQRFRDIQKKSPPSAPNVARPESVIENQNFGNLFVFCPDASNNTTCQINITVNYDSTKSPTCTLDPDHLGFVVWGNQTVTLQWVISSVSVATGNPPPNSQFSFRKATKWPLDDTDGVELVGPFDHRDFSPPVFDPLTFSVDDTVDAKGNRRVFAIRYNIHVYDKNDKTNVDCTVKDPIVINTGN